MQLIADWANRTITDRGSGAAQIELHVEGLRDLHPQTRSRYSDLGLEEAPVDSSGRSLWDDLVVNFDVGKIMIVVASTDHGSEIRQAIDLQLAKVAREMDLLEQAEREQEHAKEQQAKQREDQLARLRADLGN